MNNLKSLTQQFVSEKEIFLIIFQQFGKDEKIGKILELSEGYYSVAYSVELLSQPYDIVIKFAPQTNVHQLRYEYLGIQTEVAFMKLLEEENTKLNCKRYPIPELLVSDFSREIIKRDYFITKKFTGVSWKSMKKKLTKDENFQIAQKIGALTAQINAIQGDHFGYLVENNPSEENKSQTSDWGESFSKMIQNLIEDAKKFNVNLPKSDSEIIEMLSNSILFLKENFQPKLVHWDLWEGNIFIIQNNGKWEIEGIIDFERGLWGDPLMEVMFREGFSPKGFIQGYSMTFSEIPYATERCYLYEIYLSMIFLIESKARGYPFILKFAMYILGKTRFKKNWKKLFINIQTLNQLSED